MKMRFHRSLKTLALSFCFLLFLTAISQSASGADIRFSSGRSALSIPFEMEDNLIYIPVSINGSQPLSFIFDTGAFTIVDLRRAEALGVKLKRTGRQTSGVGDEQQDVFLAANKVSFGLPGVTLSGQRLLAVSLEKVEDCVNRFVIDAEGREVSSSSPAGTNQRRKVDGILGKEFFSNFVVEIDYASRLINVHDPRAYTYSGRGEKLNLDIGEQHIFVQAGISAHGRESLTGRFMIDTGGAMAVTLTKRFTDEHQLLPPLEQLTPVPLCGLAGITKVQSLLGSAEALQLGKLKLANPLVEFRQASVDYDFDGFIGGAVFRRYKVIFDYSRRQMILEQADATASL